MPNATPISAVVITKNEERHLPDCLKSLDWADEIVVVDSFSTDATPTLAQKLAHRFVQHPFENYAAQRNFAQAQASHDWVFFLDADERVSPHLRLSLTALAQSGRIAECNAYYIKRANLFSGRWLDGRADGQSTFSAADRRRVHPGAQRLLNRKLAVWERAIHEVIRVPEPSGFLDGLILHYSITTLSAACEPLNRYSDIEAAERHRQNPRRPSLAEALARGVLKFGHTYLAQGRWRCGEQGLLLALLAGYNRFLDYAKLNERCRALAGEGEWLDADLEFFRSFDTRA